MTIKEDHLLAELEDQAREMGYDLPIAWAIGWLIDNESSIAIMLFQNRPSTEILHFGHMMQELKRNLTTISQEV